MNTVLVDFSAQLKKDLGEKLLETAVANGELTLNCNLTDILEICRFLRDHIQYRFVNLTDICGVDWPEREKRFDIVYHLLSPTQNLRVRIKIESDENQPVPSITELFPAAEWFEREIYDMYGVLFSSHPDLRRILTDYGFDGHPLRKDFPVTGFVEVRYDDEQKRVVYEPVKLTQEFRDFDFLSPWEGTEYEIPGDEKSSLN